MRELQIARRLAEAVAGEGGRAYFVGGYVRDQLMGRETKDIDVESLRHRARAPARAARRSWGRVFEKGASFGVLSLEHTNLDIAMPRRESRTGARHTDFDVLRRSLAFHARGQPPPRFYRQRHAHGRAHAAKSSTTGAGANDLARRRPAPCGRRHVSRKTLCAFFAPPSSPRALKCA